MGKAARKDHREALVLLQGHVPKCDERSDYSLLCLELYSK